MSSAFLAVSSTAVVWLVIGLVTLAAIAAMVAALVRQGLLIGRAVRRLNDEVAPIVTQIQARNPATGRRPASRL